MKQRIIWADAVKGFTILLMVMGHVLAWNYADRSFLLQDVATLPTNKIYGGIIWKLIYSFHMSLLFFISAYLSYKTDFFTFREVCKNTVNKFQRLMFPFFLTGFLVFFVRGVYGYWFLFVLFEFYLAYSIVSFLNQKINKKQNLLLELALLIIPFVFVYIMRKIFNGSQMANILDFERFSENYLFFVFGTLMKKYNHIEKFFSKNNIFTLSVVMYVGLILIYKYEILTIPHKEFTMSSLTKFCAIISIIYFFRKVFDENTNFIQKSLSYIGKYTLEIYMFHICFVIQISAIGDFILSQSNVVTSVTVQLVVSFVFSVIAIVLSIILGKFISKSNILSYLLLGKRIIH